MDQADAQFNFVLDQVILPFYHLLLFIRQCLYLSYIWYIIFILLFFQSPNNIPALLGKYAHYTQPNLFM